MNPNIKKKLKNILTVTAGLAFLGGALSKDGMTVRELVLSEGATKEEAARELGIIALCIADTSSWCTVLSSSEALKLPAGGAPDTISLACFLLCLIMLCFRVNRFWQMSHSNGRSPGKYKLREDEYNNL